MDRAGAHKSLWAMDQNLDSILEVVGVSEMCGASVGVCETQIRPCHLGVTLDSQGRFSPRIKFSAVGSARILPSSVS